MQIEQFGYILSSVKSLVDPWLRWQKHFTWTSIRCCTGVS